MGRDCGKGERLRVSMTKNQGTAETAAALLSASTNYEENLVETAMDQAFASTTSGARAAAIPNVEVDKCFASAAGTSYSAL